MPLYKMTGKKDGMQKYKVRVNYMDNGIARQLDRIAYGLAEAKELEMRLLHETKNKDSASRITLDALFNEYITTKRHEIRESTIDKSVRVINSYVLSHFNNVRIDKLNTKALQDWKNKINESNLKIKTKQNIYGEFRAMLNYAVKMEYLPKNPLLVVGNFKDSTDFSAPKDKICYYTPQQFTEYIKIALKCALKDDNIKEWSYFTFFNIAFFTGARKGEINALKWSDIEGNVMHIRRSVTQKIKGKPIVETPPKNKSSYRDIIIPTPLMSVLTDHKQRQMAMPEFSEDYRVCGGLECLRDTSLENKNIYYAQEAGLPHIRIHDFRHSHASLLCNEGINIQEIARRLGHSKIEMTWDTYSHLYPREEERALSILNQINID